MVSDSSPLRTRRHWLAICSELSPLGACVLTALALWVVATFVPDGRMGDRLDYIFWTVGAFGLGACGLGWLVAGRRLVAVSLFTMRSILIAAGVALIEAGLSGLCEGCARSWTGANWAPLITSGLLLSAVSFGLPLASAIWLFRALRGRSVRTGGPAAV